MASTTPTFAVASRDKIQGYIDAKILQYPSYVLCKNTYDWVYVDKDLKMHDIKGRDQASISSVDVLPEEFKENTFYLCNGIGYLSISGKLVPVFKEISESAKSYNDLADVPVINKSGEMGAEVVLSDLDDGSYSISGNYIIGGSFTTTFIASSSVMVLVESDENYKYITRLGAKQVCVYKFDIATGEVAKDEYVTESWITEQGYTTKTYVDEAIEALYQRLANEALIITKLSQLENDMGFLTMDNFGEISEDKIADLF